MSDDQKQEEQKSLDKVKLDLKKHRERISKYQRCIACSGRFTFGLKSDGTVLVAGEDEITEGEKVTAFKYNVSDWRNISAIFACDSYIIGLQRDGTVVAAVKEKYINGLPDYDNNVEEILQGYYGQDIIDISIGHICTVGLKSDGTVIAVGYNQYGKCNTFSWRDIIAISTGAAHTVGLKSDGTVVAVGYNEYGQCNTSGWRDIVAISAGENCTVGLKSDGTVVAVGSRGFDKNIDTSGWHDIVAISLMGKGIFVGLKSDGTVVHELESNVDGNRYNTSGWTNIGPLMFTKNEIPYLDICRVCKKNVSSEAISCPHCGDPYITEKKKYQIEKKEMEKARGRRLEEITDYIKRCTENNYCAVCGKIYRDKKSLEHSFWYKEPVCNCDRSVLYKELDSEKFDINKSIINEIIKKIKKINDYYTEKYRKEREEQKKQNEQIDQSERSKRNDIFDW